MAVEDTVRSLAWSTGRLLALNACTQCLEADYIINKWFGFLPAA